MEPWGSRQQDQGIARKIRELSLIDDVLGNLRYPRLIFVIRESEVDDHTDDTARHSVHLPSQLLFKLSVKCTPLVFHVDPIVLCPSHGIPPLSKIHWLLRDRWDRREALKF